MAVTPEGSVHSAVIAPGIPLAPTALFTAPNRNDGPEPETGRTCTVTVAGLPKLLRTDVAAIVILRDIGELRVRAVPLTPSVRVSPLFLSPETS